MLPCQARPHHASDRPISSIATITDDLMEFLMKTLGLAMALALTGSTVEAATLFEVPINGGIARFQLGEDCEQPVCASISWSENGRRHDHQNRKEPSHKETAKRSPRVKSEPMAKLLPSESAPVLGSPSVDEVPPSAPAQTPVQEDLANSGSGAEPTATASRAPDAGVAPADPVLEPGSAAPVAPPKLSANKDPAVSPVGEWLV